MQRTELFKIMKNLTNKDNPQSDDLALRDIDAKNEKIKNNSKNKLKKQSTNSISKRRDESYKRTLNRIQSELKPVNRILSKIIHNKFIEKISEVIGQTIARPNAMLLGSIFAFILTLFTYTIAKKIGYKLSGIETILSFIIGWIIGIVYDYLKTLINTNKP